MKKKSNKKTLKEFGLELWVLIVLGLLVLIFIGIVPFLIMVLVPVVLLYVILDRMQLEEKVKKIVWIFYIVVLVFLVLERII